MTETVNDNDIKKSQQNNTVRMRVWLFLAGFSFLMLPLSMQAEQVKDFDQYSIHYSAFTTDNLVPEVAKKYGIKRSKKRALLNVSVLKKMDDGPSKPSTALLKVTATNLSQQLRQLEPREIADGGAIYYIAETPVDNAETLKYVIEVTPSGEETTYTFDFKSQFFTE